MNQNNNGYFPQGGQQYPQQDYNPNQQPYPQQGYNPNQQPYPQQGYNPNQQPYPQQGYNPQQYPQQMNYGYQPVTQQKNSSTGKTVGIVCGVIAAIFLIACIAVYFSESHDPSGGDTVSQPKSLDSMIVGTWVKGSSEVMELKSDHTIVVTEYGSTEVTGTWSVNSDKQLTLDLTNSYGSRAIAELGWCDPGQTPEEENYWYVTDSNICLMGDVYSRSN